ncbi:MAG: FAD-binding protein [Sphaerochaeta sp.]|nr:FAD-binding protein [Sphaerochaeta sp.]
MKQGESFCNLATYISETVIVGSGAAGYNAADTLYRMGNSEVVLLSEDLAFGTSRNTGSDKQTYYKLSLCGSEPDSVRAMAEDLFNGGAVDGDLALVEAALSTKSFLKLSDLGVPFPTNRYGEFVGYKTDHDPKRRATSAGPYTSRFMTEFLESSLKERGAALLGGFLVVKILVDEHEVKGVLCLETKNSRFCIFWCRNLIWATGGPAVMYANSVYPASQFGSSGLAFEAGCKGRNLTEWQYGLASLTPRWNVSGTYMQVLPRFFSVDEKGIVHDFLRDQFEDSYHMLSLVFLKGYQWPFDVRKISKGSSIIDLLVYRELEQERRVYLDFTRNPIEGDVDFSSLDTDAYVYLKHAGADFGLPVDRLKVMNAPAYEFYKERGTDLEKDMLEISLCAQHNNGGLAVDLWYQSDVAGLFAVGEVAGSHGVYRPGGSALNAGQVGSARAASYIMKKCHDENWVPTCCCREQIEEILTLAKNGVGREDTAMFVYRKVRKQMGLHASLLRRYEDIHALREEIAGYLAEFETLQVNAPAHLPFLFRLRDCLLSQVVYLSAMEEYIKAGGKSRGSSLYLCSDGEPLHPLLPPDFRAHLEGENPPSFLQEVSFKGGVCAFSWRAPHPLPLEDDFFEKVWKEFREHGNVY